MSRILLSELTEMLTQAIGFEIKAAIKAAVKAKENQDMENFLMSQSYVLGLQKAVDMINTVLASADLNLSVEK